MMEFLTRFRVLFAVPLPKCDAAQSLQRRAGEFGGVVPGDCRDLQRWGVRDISSDFQNLVRGVVLMSGRKARIKSDACWDSVHLVREV